MSSDKDYTDKQMKVFEELLKAMGIQNYTIKFSLGTAINENFMSDIIEVDVEWRVPNEKNATTSFVIKSGRTCERFRKLVYLEDCFKRETYIYSKVFCEFAKIQEEKRILTPFKSYPVFYTSMTDYKHEMIIFENVKRSGFKNWKREQPLDFDHTLLIVKELGRLHALSYAIRDQKPELFEEIVANTQDVLIQDFRVKGLIHVTRVCFEEVQQALNPVKDKQVYQKFLNFSENIFEILIKLSNPKSIDQYAVVGHGDCGIPNYLFKYDNVSNTPTQVCMVDWQLTRIGSPVLDLSCFLFTATDNKLRDSHYHNFIMAYYNSLRSFLTALGSDSEKLLPFEVLQSQLKKYSFFGLFFSILLIYSQTTSTQDIPEYVESKGYVKKEVDMTKFYIRVRDVILDFDRLGYNYEY